MYGYAHGQLEGFVFGTINLLGRIAGGGQVEVVLPKGARVRATYIARTNPHTEGRPPQVFRLCVIALGPAARSVEVATWIATSNLDRPRT
jgi:hypothetical protein